MDPLWVHWVSACTVSELLFVCSADFAACLWALGSPLLSPQGNEAFCFCSGALNRVRGSVDIPGGLRFPMVNSNALSVNPVPRLFGKDFFQPTLCLPI